MRVFDEFAVVVWHYATQEPGREMKLVSGPTKWLQFSFSTNRTDANCSLYRNMTASTAA